MSTKASGERPEADGPPPGRQPGAGREADSLTPHRAPLDRVSVPSPVCGSAGKESACDAGDLGSTLGWEDGLEKGKAMRARVPAWGAPRSVQSLGSQRVGLDRAAFIFTPVGLEGVVSAKVTSRPHPQPAAKEQTFSLLSTTCLPNPGHACHPQRKKALQGDCGPNPGRNTAQGDGWAWEAWAA